MEKTMTSTTAVPESGQWTSTWSQTFWKSAL